MRRLTILFLLCAVRAAAAAGPAPLWPLDLETRFLTSNFMEHRSGRFHAGLDFKTRSRTGFPVRAVEDGWISRIRVSSAGYGRAIYLRGDSGRTYVYAHLERFGDRWREAVRRVQVRRGDYGVTLQFPAGKHAVRRGEILALSGQSGTVGPHLHFEVRDGANRPVDPQACGFAVPDTLAPSILSVRVMPAAPEARVEGERLSRSVGDGPLSGELPPLRVSGPVAFTARVVETSDVRGHRLEPYRLAVVLDDSLVFESRNEAYAFAAQARMRLEWFESDGPRERWLHRRPGDDLPGRLGGGWSLDPDVLGPGRHRVRLSVEDRAGNRAEVAWTLESVSPGATANGDASWRADPVRVAWTDPATGRERWLTPFLAADGDSVGPARPAGEAPFSRPLYAIVPDSLDAGEQRKAARAQGLYAPLWSARVLAADWSSVRPAVCRLDTTLPDPLPEAWGLYAEGRRGWSWAGRPVNRDGRRVVDLGGPGRYALLRDDGAPYLGPGPEEGLVRRAAPSGVAEVTAPAWEIVTIRAEDLGSGLDVETLEASWDGTQLIVEPDPPRDRLRVELPDDASPGAHVLEIAVSDRAGHAVERRYELVLVDGS